MRITVTAIAFAVLVFLPADICSQDTTTNSATRKLAPVGATDGSIGDTLVTQPTSYKSREELDRFVFRQIEFETKRLDILFKNTEAVGKIMAALIIGFAAILSFFGYRNIKDIKGELESSVESLVDKTLKERNEDGATFEKLITRLSSAQERWNELEKSIDDLDKFASLSTSQYGDAQGAYREANSFAERADLTTDERRSALGYVNKIIELGENGTVDPNLLFNSCSVASTLDFDHEALKLATLCAHWDPKPSHILQKSRHEDVFGIRFELKAHALVLLDQEPQVVRSEAWKVAKDSISKNPTYQCELIYAQLSNIAIRNRESGFIDDAIAVIEELIDRSTVPSYSYTTLATFYVLRGNSTWLDDYLETVAKSIRVLSEESPASTWYKPTIRDINNTAKLTDKLAEIESIMEQEGITRN